MNNQSPIFAIAVMGPTASGKSDIAEFLAQEFNAVLINADSYQIYRGLNVGTNKPKNIENYRLIDILDPHEDYGLGQFIRDSHEILAECQSSKKNAIFVGGTGYYIRGLFESYQDFSPAPPAELREEANRLWEKIGPEGMKELVLKLTPLANVEWQNRHRACRAYERAMLPPPQKPEVFPIDIKKVKISIEIELESLKNRINIRARKMVSEDWLHEVQKLLDSNTSLSSPGMKAIGYREMAEVIRGEMSLESAVTRVQELTWQYAKRQRTWLRSEPNLKRINGEDSLASIVSQVRVLLSQ